MKKIIAPLLLATSLQLLTATAPMIINRTGQAITVAYSGTSGALFATGNDINVSGDSAHTGDKMILIPSTSVEKPGSSPAANYQASAVSAVVKVGSATVNISSFPANTSYVIEPTAAGATTFKATAGAIVYDTVTGIGTPGSPSPIAPGAGF